MKWINNLIGNNIGTNNIQATENGLCSLCWGWQEYDQQLRTFYKDKQIDVKNGRAKYMRVQEFVVNYIKGIQLKEPDLMTCPDCGTEHQRSHECPACSEHPK